MTKTQCLIRRRQERGLRSLENQESVRMTDFQDKRNEEIGHYGQTLINKHYNLLHAQYPFLFFS